MSRPASTSSAISTPSVVCRETPSSAAQTLHAPPPPRRRLIDAQARIRGGRTRCLGQPEQALGEAFRASVGLAGRRQPSRSNTTRAASKSVKVFSHGSPNSRRGRAADVLGHRLDRLGAFLAGRGQPGDAEQALKHYTSAASSSPTTSLTRNPESAEDSCGDVSVSLNKLGELLAKRGLPGDADQALKYYTRSLKIREGTLTRNPPNPQAGPRTRCRGRPRRARRVSRQAWSAGRRRAGVKYYTGEPRNS